MQKSSLFFNHDSLIFILFCRSQSLADRRFFFSFFPFIVLDCFFSPFFSFLFLFCSTKYDIFAPPPPSPFGRNLVHRMCMWAASYLSRLEPYRGAEAPDRRHVSSPVFGHASHGESPRAHHTLTAEISWKALKTDRLKKNPKNSRKSEASTFDSVLFSGESAAHTAHYTVVDYGEDERTPYIFCNSLNAKLGRTTNCTAFKEKSEHI